MAKCPECAEYARKCWQVRIMKQIDSWALLEVAITWFTITSNRKLKTFDACAAVYSDAWHKLSQRARRLGKMEYIIVPEKHEDGRLHVHGIWTVPVGDRWLKDTAPECGLGYQCHHAPLTLDGFAPLYVTKYLGKKTALESWPKGFRRVRTSQHFPGLDKRDNIDPVGEICIGAQATDRRLAHLERTGMRLLNGLTGEYVSMLDTIENKEYKNLSF